MSGAKQYAMTGQPYSEAVYNRGAAAVGKEPFRAKEESVPR